MSSRCQGLFPPRTQDREKTLGTTLVLYDQQFNQWPLHGTKIKLKAYNGVQIPVYGEVHLPVVYEQQELVLPLIVVDGDGPPLLGRNWLEQLKLNWRFHVSEADTLSYVLSRHKMVFERNWEPLKVLRRI